jgi:branched-chain amino acid transport system substrate-binding protein
MFRRLVLCVAAVAVVATALAACGDSSKTITIGALYPRTGTQGAGGTEELRGVQLAADWANNTSVVRGTRIKLAEVDAARAEAVPDAMDDLVRRGASIVVGSHGSAISAAAAAAASRLGMVFWETGAVGQTSSPEVAGGRNFFRLAPMGENLGRAAIDFVGDQLAPKLGPGSGGLRYAVAYVDDVYGRAVAAGAADQVRRRGLTLAGTFPYRLGTTDFRPVVAQLAAARPDVLFVTAYLDDGVALRRATVAAHLPLRASIGTSSSYCMPAFGQQLGADAVGLFASDKPDAADVRASALRPEGRAALAWASSRYTARWHTAMSAPALSGFSNAYALLAHVLPAAKATSASSIAAAALRVKLPEGTLANGGGVDLAPPGSADPGANRNAAGVIWEWVGPGRRAVVWPPAFATHPVVALPLSR